MEGMRSGRPRAPWIITALSLAASVALGVTAVVAEPAPASEAAQAPSAAPAGETTDAGALDATPPPDIRFFDLDALPRIDVWTVDPRLPIDTDPFAATTGELATPSGAGAPIFAEPGADPIGYLPAAHVYGGSTVPVIERRGSWLKVLLAGRQGLPPEGSAAQTVGWLREADVALRQSDAYVEVHLEARTIDVVSAAGRERVVADFAWGKPSTPTPIGRSFIMLTAVEPSFAYTEGHPIVYLAVQSPTLAGFDGGSVAVTSFHYYRTRSGPNSFGCIYLDSAAITRLAELPAGTPVLINP